MDIRFLFACMLAFAGLGGFPGRVEAQVDPDATDKTIALYANLKRIQNSGQFMFGQEFFNSYRYSSGSPHGNRDYSDSKAVSGAHPAVLGSDFHYYLEKNATEQGYHLEAVKWAFQQGCAITFDWHLSGRGTTTYEYTETTKNLVNNIVLDQNGDRAWFLAELDKAINIINHDLVVNGERIPVVFRPWHEMGGNWFWWGTRATTPDHYKAFYQLTVNYVKERTNSVLFCWSPNEPAGMNYYPGNDYVDVIGLDYYEVEESRLRSQLALLVDHAQANGKVAVLSETGYRINSDAAGEYWNKTLLPAIRNDPTGKAKKIAWVLTWINSAWSFPYVPHANSGAAARQSFIAFRNSPDVLFADELPDLYTPPGPLSTSQDVWRPAFSLQIVPSSGGEYAIKLDGFKSQTEITIYDLTGRIALKRLVEGELTVIPVEGMLQPGLYLLRASDCKKTLTERLLVR